MAQTTVSVRVDEDLKRDVERLAEDFGMNLTTLITVCLKAVEREREIPFKISSRPSSSSPATRVQLAKDLQDYREGKGAVIVKTMDELEAMSRE